MERKIKVENLEYLGSDFMDKEVSLLVSDLNLIRENYGKKGYFKIYLEADNTMDGLYGYNLRGERLETDEEMEKRKIKTEKQKLAAAKRKDLTKKTDQEKEYQTYLKLKKKFE